MKAVPLHGYGDIDQLRYEDSSIPEPKPDEVLVKVAGTSINPIDWKMRSGEAKDRMQEHSPQSWDAILLEQLSNWVRTLGP